MTEQTQKPARRVWTMFLPLATVLLLAVLWSIYWVIAIGVAKDQASQIRERLAADGITLMCNQESWAGFPFRFELTCTSPVFTMADRLDVRSGNLLLVALAYNPWQVVALIDGPTSAVGKDVLPVKADHGRIIASLTFGRAGFTNFSSEFPNVKIPGLASAKTIMIHARPANGDAVEVAASVEALSIQPPGKPEISVDTGQFQGIVSPARTLDIESFSAVTKGIQLSAKGKIALDPQNRPEGTIDTETSDLQGLLGIVLPQLQISQQQQDAARAVFGLMGKEAKAPIIMKNGQLFVGPIKGLDLQPLY